MRKHHASLVAIVLGAIVTSCTPTTAAKSTTGEGERAAEGEGEGEGANLGEGEGEGEGEGGDVGEGEGVGGEGEGEGSDVGEGEGEGEGDGAGPTAASCFASLHSSTGVAPNYDQFHPVINAGCTGTHHQDIVGVERVVFLGDSVSVGTPPTLPADTYRSLLADQLAAAFGIAAPSTLWKTYDVQHGKALVKSSGAFWSCAEWGANSHDLAAQIADCFPAEERTKKTLVIMTMGGNDVAAITKEGLDGVPYDAIVADAQVREQLIIDGVRALVDPAQFPAGNFVVFGSPPEFTDGTGDTASCPAASAAGFGSTWSDPAALAEIVVGMLESYMELAVDTQTDLMFFLESFCGHGYHHDDPTAGCYRGPDTPLWFDVSCTHPNPAGHSALAGLFRDTVGN